MRNKRRQAGVTLVEMMVVVAIAALMIGLTIPAANMLLNSFESESGAKSIISAAMASARAIAAKEQHYAGIRFQKRYDPNNPDPLNESQYIIFIVQDPNIMAYGFRAVEGIQPIKLPDSIGVMDLQLGSINLNIDRNDRINSSWQIVDTTAFSIVFSPSGKLVIHDVRVRNRNGIPDSPGEITNPSADDIFNKKDEVDNGIGLFYQDDYAAQDYRLRYYPTNFGLGSESSRNNFVIYDTKKLKQADVNYRWTNYLYLLKPIYINPYTGTIINEK